MLTASVKFPQTKRAGMNMYNIWQQLKSYVTYSEQAFTQIIVTDQLRLTRDAVHYKFGQKTNHPTIQPPNSSDFQD